MQPSIPGEPSLHGPARLVYEAERSRGCRGRIATDHGATSGISKSFGVAHAFALQLLDFEGASEVLIVEVEFASRGPHSRLDHPTPSTPAIWYTTSAATYASTYVYPSTNAGHLHVFVSRRIAATVLVHWHASTKNASSARHERVE